MPNDQIDAMASSNDTAFSAFNASMQNVWKSAPEIWQAYSQFEQARQTLDDAAAGIGLAHDRIANDPYLTAEARQEVIANHKYIFDAAEKEAPDRMRLALKEVRATAQAAIEADMASANSNADPSRQVIVRQDLD